MRLFASGTHLKDQHAVTAQASRFSLSLSFFDPASLDHALSRTQPREHSVTTALRLAAVQKSLAGSTGGLKTPRHSGRAYNKQTTTCHCFSFIFALAACFMSCAHSASDATHTFSQHPLLIFILFLFKLMFSLFSSINANPTRRLPTADYRLHFATSTSTDARTGPCDVARGTTMVELSQVRNTMKAAKTEYFELA